MAEKTAASGLKQISASLVTTGLSLSANQGSTDKEFARAADLPLAAAEKKQIEAERGTTHSDYTLHFARVKGMTIDGRLYNAFDSLVQSDHKLEKIDAQYAPTKKTSFAYKTDADLTNPKAKRPVSITAP